MGNALFIVWRESVEALLVIGVLHAWIKRNDEGGGGLRALWLGVAGGVALAALLAWGMLSVQDELSGAALDWFQLAMLLGAAALIVQMVLWMQRHGRNMKHSLEQGMARANERAGARGIAAVVALAVAREGGETAIFLYGMGMEQQGRAGLALGAGAGFALACATSWAVSRSLGALNYRQFFRLSGLVLLLFAVALLVTGVDRAIGMGVLPALVDPLWDSSALLDDGGGAGAIVAALTGYRARPSLMLAALYAAYWIVVLLAQRRLARRG